jgi:folate-binding Fe-S cluster repair protein YgfZ
VKKKRDFLKMLKTLLSLKTETSGGVVTKLCNRKVILLEGSDTYAFLNGMVTNKIEKNSETQCTYGAFLNGKGRMLGDALFYHRPSLGSYMIELSSSHASQIVQHLQSFKLRKKIFIDYQEVFLPSEFIS